MSQVPKAMGVSLPSHSGIGMLFFVSTFKITNIRFLDGKRCRDGYSRHSFGNFWHHRVWTAIFVSWKALFKPVFPSQIQITSSTRAIFGNYLHHIIDFIKVARRLRCQNRKKRSPGSANTKSTENINSFCYLEGWYQFSWTILIHLKF
jgi:hypothetical protein